MSQFAYKARSEFGKAVKGVIEAENEEELASNLSQMGYYLISVKETKSNKNNPNKGNPNGATTDSFRHTAFQWGRFKSGDLITFTGHLATMLSADIPILEGLEDLAVRAEGPAFKKVAEEVHKEIHDGLSLSDALSRHPKVFSELYVNVVKAGEATGNVPLVLSNLTRFLEWQQTIASNIKRATIYPATVLSAVGALLTFLLVFAFPRITGILSGMDHATLPLITRIVMFISNSFQHYWYFVPLCVVGVTIISQLLTSLPKWRMVWDRFKLNMPIIGEFTRKIALSRFANYLAMLHQAGVDISQSLSIVEKVVGNMVISQTVRTAREQVLAGQSISKSIEDSGEFPSMVIRMIAIGESTGNMSESLQKVRQYYDNEIPATVQKVFSVMEPLIIVFLAIVVGVVAISIYLPIYDVIGRIGK